MVLKHGGPCPDLAGWKRLEEEWMFRGLSPLEAWRSVEKGCWSLWSGRGGLSWLGKEPPGALESSSAADGVWTRRRRRGSMPRVWVSETWRRMPSLGAVELGWLRTRLYRGRLQWGALVLSRLVGSEDLDEEQLWAAGLMCGSKALNQGGSMHKRTEKIYKILKLVHKNP
jgi:hypothetical protein